MAGASMNGIKTRIKSVESTMQITKAMELVATSKLRRAKEAVERSRPFLKVLDGAIDTLICSNELKNSVWANGNSAKKSLYIVIAGDRGLAGGYNANVFRLVGAKAEREDVVILPIGKKAVEYFKAKGYELYCDSYSVAADVGVGDSLTLADSVCRDFAEGTYEKVIVVYTKFVSMITQTPICEQIFPIKHSLKNNDPLIESEPEELIKSIAPSYLGGIVWASLCESLASESGARRSAMNAANKNAGEMIDTLLLKYNRARQAVITQEITEIVSGAEAL